MATSSIPQSDLTWQPGQSGSWQSGDPTQGSWSYTGLPTGEFVTGGQNDPTLAAPGVSPGYLAETPLSLQDGSYAPSGPTRQVATASPGGGGFGNWIDWVVPAAIGVGTGALGASIATGAGAAAGASGDASALGGDVGAGGTGAGVQYLPATTDATTTSLSPDVASTLGVAPTTEQAGLPAGYFDMTAGLTSDVPIGQLPADTSVAGAGGVAGTPIADSPYANFGSYGSAGDAFTGAGGADVTGAAAGGADSTDWLSKLGKWFGNPKNDLQLGGLGLSLLTGLKKPQLPGATQTAMGNATALAPQAQSTLASGGMSGPIWQQQKASIDATIEQEMQQAMETAKQQMANSGMGGNNSAVVQQQLQAIQQKFNTQRQQLYMQAAQQNVSQAMSELTQADSTLMGVGNLQLQQSEAARNQALNIALLTMKLGSMFSG